MTKFLNPRNMFVSLWIMGLFYLAAGINHFVHPEFYLPLIPPYLPIHSTINLLSGAIEVFFALLLLFKASRKWACYGIIAMLIAFIPAHVYFIEVNSCAGGLCVPPWVGWIRLVVVHPLLIYWAWANRNY